MSKPDDAAHPIVDTYGLREFGLTKRELFASMALQGMLANDRYWTGSDAMYEAAAADACSFADALLTALTEG